MAIFGKTATPPAKAPPAKAVIQVTGMTTGPVLKVLAPSDSHAAIIAKSVALGVPTPQQFRAFCEISNELNALIIANGAIPAGRKHAVLTLDILEKLNSM